MLPAFPPAVLLTAPLKPLWIWSLPEFPGRVYGLGVAPVANTRALATRQASDGARADVIARLRASLKSDTQVRNEYLETRTLGGQAPTTTAARTTSASTDVQIQAQAADIPGLIVESTYLDESSQPPTLYALAYLDFGVANQELRARLDDIAGSLKADSGDGLRAKLHRAQVLSKALADLLKLEDLFSLVRAGGGDSALGAPLLKARLAVEAERAALRTSLTFGMPVNAEFPVDPELRGAVRTAILEQGLGWSDRQPDLVLTLRGRKARHGVETSPRVWWNYQRTPDFIMAQGTLSLSLADRAGQEYESILIVAKGVGSSEFQAETLLLQDYRNKLIKAIPGWLANLGN